MSSSDKSLPAAWKVELTYMDICGISFSLSRFSSPSLILFIFPTFDSQRNWRKYLLEVKSQVSRQSLNSMICICLTQKLKSSKRIFSSLHSTQTSFKKIKVTNNLMFWFLLKFSVLSFKKESALGYGPSHSFQKSATEIKWCTAHNS